MNMNKAVVTLSCGHSRHIHRKGVKIGDRVKCNQCFSLFWRKIVKITYE